MLPTPAPLIGDEPDRSHPLMDGLAVWYPFSEGGGTTAFDVGPRKNNGTLTSMAAATDWVIGPRGKALDLDATNDYVLIDGGNYVADHNLPLTICWWERITSNTGASTISRFRIANTNTSVNRSFLVLRASHVDYQPVCWGGSNTINTGPGTNFRSPDVPSIADSVGVWNHFVLVCHGGVASQVAGDYSLYLNGRRVSVTSARGLNLANSSSRFGYDAVTAGSNCRMADVRLYTRGLSSSDAFEVYSDPWAPFARRKVYGLGTTGGGGTTIDATTASIHITPLAATVTPATSIASTTAVVDVSPLLASVSVGTSVAASVAALSVAPLPASVSAGVLVESTAAAINAAPLAATVSVGTAVTASTAAMQIGGLAASVAAGVSITATVAQVTIAGNAASVASGVSVSAAVAALHCTALPASVSVGTSISASVAAVEITGNAASVSAVVSVQATTGVVRIASLPVSITFGGRIRRPHLLTGGRMSQDWGLRSGGAL